MVEGPAMGRSNWDADMEKDMEMNMEIADGFYPEIGSRAGCTPDCNWLD
jgi:hypothetical protein